MGVGVGFLLLAAASTYTWLAFTLISTAGEHSGYTFFNAERHDAHHEHFK